MDPGSTAATAAAAAATGTQQASTVVVEKSCTTTEEPETPPASGKNGSVPDSSADSTKETVSISPAKLKEVLSPSPKQASNDDVVVKACELNSTVVDSLKSPSKQPVTTSTSVDAVGQESKPKDKEPAKSDKTLDTVECNDNPVDPEDDDLLRRMEAIEKGEDLDLVNEKEGVKKAISNHQNGMSEQEELTKKQTETTSTVKPIDTTAVTEKSSQLSDISITKQSPSTSDVKVTSETVATKSADVAVNSNAKRKHSLNEIESNEPEVKKVHVGDVTDASGKINTNTNAQSCDRTENTGPPPVPSELELEKPLSVEKMEVDGSPEPEPSKEVDVLPADTEPNTATESVAMEEKTEEISSSVAEEPMRVDSETTSASGKADNSNVSSSSDDKREAASEKPNVSDSEVSASVLPAPSEEEAMDVDEDVSDMAESSTSAGGVPTVPAPIPVVEPPCVKKFAYQCTEDEQKADEITKKDTVVSTGTVSATSSTVDSAKMEVDSGVKASSTKAAGAKTLAQGEDEVDSSNVATSVAKVAIPIPAADKVTESGKTSKADESVVESSLPSSSSDTKKKPEHRLNDQQLREAVHRSGLLAKATSTPNSSAVVITPSSSHPSTPKTQTPVTTSAVSSSNVYSSTPIHPNCGKVGSGNVSKITNPPSSVETSRIETDDTVTATTTATNTSSASTTEKSSITSLEEKKPSPAPSAGSKAETESLPTTVSAGTSDSSAKSSSSPKKELRKDDSSSSTKSSASEVDSCTVGSDMNTTEEINLYISNARKLNGISSTSEGTDVESKSETACKASGVVIKQEEDSKAGVSSVHLDLSHAIAPTTSVEQQYEVCVWYEGKELQFMSVERIFGGEKVDSSVVVDPATHDSSTMIDSSSKQSSSATTNGSVSSLGPFTLPTSGKPANVGQTSDSSSSSSVATVTGTKLVHSLSVPQMKQTIMGPKALCDLIIDEFKKLRRTIAPDDEDAPEHVDDTLLGVKSPKTPAVVGGRGRAKESAKKSSSRGQKRSKAIDSDDDDEAGVTSGTPRTGGSSSASKQPAKRTKGGSTESPVTTSSVTPKSQAVPEPKDFDICCLARWTDRKYYAGRVTNYRGDNKYVVRFEDGCSKTLSRDIIVFGEDGVLPIKHHSIHALTGGDTYEPAIVEEIKRNEANEVVYGVRTASSNLEVTATDIYLTDEQAKWIHNACKDKPDPIQAVGGAVAGEGGDTGASGGSVADGNTVASDALLSESGEKGSRATRSKRGAGSSDKSMTPATPEAGYSGGVGKKGRRGRRLS